MDTIIQPDSGLQLALQSVIKNERFKQLLIFGLRSVAESCIPPNNNYIQNSLAVVDQNVLPLVCRTSLQSDLNEDVSVLCIKILWGISEAMRQYPSIIGSDGKKLNEKVKGENIGECLALSIAADATSTNYTVLEYGFDALLTYYDLAYPLNVRVICPAVISLLSITKFGHYPPASTYSRNREVHKRDAIVKAIHAIEKICYETAGIEGLLENGGLIKLLEALVMYPSWVDESGAISQNALNVVSVTINHPKASALVNFQEAASKTIELMQKHKNNLKIEKLGREVLLKMLQPSQISTCLDELSRICLGSKNCINSLVRVCLFLSVLNLLNIMTHVEGVGESFTGSDGIMLLLEAVRRTGDRLMNKVSEDDIEGIIKAVNMLQKLVWETNEHANTVTKSGGIETFIITIQRAAAVVHDHPKAEELISSCCNVCTSLSRDEFNASILHKKNCIQELLEATNSALIPVTAVRLFMALLGHPHIATSIKKDAEFFLNSIQRCITLVENNIEHQCNCLTVLRQLSEVHGQCHLVISTGLLATVVEVLNRFGSNTQVAFAGVQFLGTLENFSDAQACLCDGTAADALFNVIVQHQEDQELKDKAIRALDLSIATEADVIRKLKIFEHPFNKFTENDFHKSLVAINTMFQVPRLSSTQTVLNFQSEFLDLLKKLIEGGEDISSSSSLIQGCLDAITTTVIYGSSSGEHVVTELLRHAQSPPLKSLVNKQTPEMKGRNRIHGNNSLVDLLNCVININKSGKFLQLSNVDVLIGNTTQIMCSFSNHRLIQLACLNILSMLATYPDGVSTLSSDDIKLICQRMQETIKFEDVQAAGLHLWNVIMISGNRECIADALRKAGATEILQAVMKTHPNSSKIRCELLPLHSTLVPNRTIQADINAAITALNEAIATNDALVATCSIEIIAAITETPDGVAAAIEAPTIRTVSAAITRLLIGEVGFIKKSPNELVDFSCSSANIFANMLTHESGARALSNHCGVAQYFGVLNALVADDSAEVKKATKEAISRYLKFWANLMRRDKTFAESAFRKGVASKLHSVTERYADDASFIMEVFSVLGSFRAQDLAKTPEFSTLLSKMVQMFSNCASSKIELKILALRAIADFVMFNLTGRETNMKSVSVEAIIEKLVVEHQIIQGLTKALEIHRPLQDDQNTALVKEIEMLLTALCEIRYLKDRCAKALGVDINKYARNVRINKINVGDGVTVKLLNIQPVHMEKKVLEASPTLESAQEITIDHFASHSVRLAASDALSYLSPDEQLSETMKQIVELVNTNAGERAQRPMENWPEQLNQLSRKLELFLGAEIKNNEVAFERTKTCCEALMTAMENQFGPKAQIRRQNVELLSSIPAVTRCLGERFEEEEQSPYGAFAMFHSVFPTYVQLILTSSRCRKSRNFICNGYRTLTTCLRNNRTLPFLLKQFESGEFVTFPKVSFDLINGQYALDAEIVQRILELLVCLAKDPEGAERLKTIATPNRMKEFITAVKGLMTRHQNAGPTIAAALDMIGNIAKTLTPEESSKITSEKLFNRLEKLANTTPEGVAAMTRFRGNALIQKDFEAPINSEKIKYQRGDVIRKSLLDYEVSKEKFECTIQKCNMTVSLADLIESHISKNLVDELLETEALKSLTSLCCECAQEWNGEKEVLAAARRSFETLKRCAQSDTDANITICKQLMPKLLEEYSNRVDPPSAIALLDLLKELVIDEMREVNISFLNKQCAGLNSLFDRVERLASECDGPEQAQQLVVKGKKLKEVLKKDSSTEINTLRKVYALWTANEDSIENTDSVLILRHLDFVLDRTEEYSKIAHTNCHSDLATEFSYGCRCLSLLHRCSSWDQILLDRREHIFMFRALNYQTANEENICQIVVQTILNAIQTNSALAMLWVTQNEEDLAPIIVDCIRRIHEKLEWSYVKKEGLILQRIQLLECIAQNNTGGGKCSTGHPHSSRMYFNNTEAWNILVELWDNWISKNYSNQLLSHVIRSLRLLYNAEWIQLIIENECPRKLSNLFLLNKDSSDSKFKLKLNSVVSMNESIKPLLEWEVLSDALFLVGCIAHNSQIKNEMGELEIVESILKLLKVSLRYTSPFDNYEKRQLNKSFVSSQEAYFESTKSIAMLFTKKLLPIKTMVEIDGDHLTNIKKVQMNGSLALASLNIGHNNNIARFGNNGGVELNIELIGNTMVYPLIDDFDYDVANAAAALICNSSYRRPDLQQLYGEKGACEAVMSVVKRYDGSSSISATRCLTSTIKAIANLALYPANVDVFINCGIDITFEHLCNSSEHLSDNVLSVCLRTLSNLVMEFTKDSMKIFSSTLYPILQILNRKGCNDPVIFALSFDILGQLCRVPDNATIFYELQGYSIVLEHLRTLSYQEYLNHFGLKLLIRQGRMVPESFSKMIDEGVFTFAISLINNSEVPSHVSTSALQLLLQIIQSSSESATAFVQSGSLDCIFKHINQHKLLKCSKNFSELQTDGSNNEVIVPSWGEERPITLSCWVIVSLLLVYSGKLEKERSILLQSSQTSRIVPILSREKSAFVPKPFASRSLNTFREDNIEKKKNLSEFSGPPEFGVSDSAGADEFVSVYEDFASAYGEFVSTYEDLNSISESKGDPAWKRLGVSQHDFALLSKSLCGLILRKFNFDGNVHLAGSASTTHKQSKTIANAENVQKRQSPRATVDSDFLLATTGLLAYIASERLVECIAEIFEGGIIECIKSLLRHVKEGSIGEEDAIDLVRLCCATITVLGIRGKEYHLAELCLKDNGLVDVLVDCARLMNSQKGGKLLGFILPKKVYNASTVTELCLINAHLLQSGTREEFEEMFNQMAPVYPLLLTKYNRNNYPHGVQDLKIKTKEILRTGSTARALIIKQSDEYTATVSSCAVDTSISWKIGRLQWKSSSDLLKFEWRLDKNTLYESRLVSSIRYVENGWTSNAFLMASQQNTKAKLPSPTHCCVLKINTSGSSKNEEISLFFGTHRACAKFIALISEWKEAASSEIN